MMDYLCQDQSFTLKNRIVPEEQQLLARLRTTENKS